MKATLRIVGTCIALALLVGPTWADDAKPPSNPEEFAKAMAEAGKPGAEHKKLQPLEGSWTYTFRMWMDPSKSPMESKGTIERNWILGNRFLEEKIEGTNFDGKPGFEARGLLGHDNAQQKYTSIFNCNMGTGTCSGAGEFDSDGKTLTLHTECFCPMEKKVIKGRDEIRIESDDKVVIESYKTENGKDIKVMELVSVRKK